jgi:hypothetical protein
VAGKPWFYGLEPRWFRWDRLYEVYILGDRITGAYLAGQVYDEDRIGSRAAKPAPDRAAVDPAGRRAIW